MAAGNKQHAGRGDAAHEQSIVVGATDHFRRRQRMCAAGLRQSVCNQRGTASRCVGIYNFKAYWDFSSFRDGGGFALDFGYGFVPPGEVDITRVQS